MVQLKLIESVLKAASALIAAGLSFVKFIGIIEKISLAVV